MIRYSAAAANDSQFLKEIFLPKGSILVFDRGYCDYTTFNRFANDSITWVTRRRKQLTYKVLQVYKIADNDETIMRDEQIQLGWRLGTKVTARLIRYKDLASGEVYEFLSNNFRMRASVIAKLYQKRWQIELLFKRMKQNYPLKYFLGDSENAIQIQIWCSLIADLILKIIKKGAAVKWSFSNLAAMMRLHLMTYIDLGGFLRSPEKALIKMFGKSKQYNHNQLLLIT
jgi:IS4 transposase